MQSWVHHYQKFCTVCARYARIFTMTQRRNGSNREGVPTSSELSHYFASSRDAKYCDERVCMSVCSHISKIHVLTSRKFLYILLLL